MRTTVHILALTIAVPALANPWSVNSGTARVLLPSAPEYGETLFLRGDPGVSLDNYESLTLIVNQDAISRSRVVPFYFGGGSPAYVPFDSVPTVPSPERLFLADIDCDGEDEIVVVGATGEVGYHENEGTVNGPSVGPLQSMMCVDAASFLSGGAIVRDVNNDGCPDLIAAVIDNQSAMAQVRVWRNLGGGLFTQGPTFTSDVFQTGAGQNVLLLAGLEATGDLDEDVVLVADDGTVVLADNNGDGTYSNGGTITLPDVTDASSVDAGDVTGNGNDDVVVAGAGEDGNGDPVDTIFVSVQTAPGVFSTAASNPVGPPFEILFPITRVLPMKPGENEVAVGRDRTLSLNTSNSAGNLTARLSLDVPRTPFDVTAADLDDDGTTDVLNGTSSAENSTWWFKRITELPDEVTFSRGIQIEGSAFNGDESTESPLIAQGQFGYIYADGDELIQHTHVDTGLIADFQYGSECVAVFEGSFPADIVDFAYEPQLGCEPDCMDHVEYAAANDIGELFIRFPGNEMPIIIFCCSGSDTVGAVEIRDVDNDDDDDVITADACNGVTIHINNGDGTFTPTPVGGPVFIAGAYSEIYYADFNLDGFGDFAVAPGLSNEAFVYFNDQDGTFTRVQTLASSNPDALITSIAGVIVSLQTFEVDILTTERDSIDPDTGSRITRWRNDGAGTFGSPTLYETVGPRPDSLTTADIDLDGDDDIVYTNSTDSFQVARTVGALLNLTIENEQRAQQSGQTTRGPSEPLFTDPFFTPVPGVPVSVVAVQLDGVEGPELVTINQSNFGTYFGGITITPSQLSIPGFEPAPDCPGDATGDNIVNIADLNIILGNFQQSGPPGIPGDLNGDGSVDLLDLNLVLGNFQTDCVAL